MCNTKEHVERLLAERAGPEPSGKKHKKPVSNRARATAAKVALMKIKMKAVGHKGTPDTEKVYFMVHLPQGSKDKDVAMYFSRKWTVGRVVDQIATQAGLDNMNNVAGAKKLGLFDAEGGQRLPMEETLESIMGSDDSPVFSGSSVVLDYVES